MRVLKVFGILIMLAVIAATIYVTREPGALGMNFREFTRYAVPAFCAGALLVAITQLSAKMAAREKKPDKGGDAKKPAG